MQTKEEKAKHYSEIMKETFNVMPVPSGDRLYTYLVTLHTLSSLAFGVYMAEEINNTINEKELAK